MRGQVLVSTSQLIWHGPASFRGATQGETRAEWDEPDPLPYLQHWHAPSWPHGSPANHTEGTEDHFEKQDCESNKTKTLKPAGTIKAVLNFTLGS